MILALRSFFLVVLASMLAITGWAGWHVPVWEIPRAVGGHPWFIATLLDAYWGFFTYYAWQFYKEPSVLARVLWLIALVLLGNIAMAVYGLAVVFRLPRNAKPEQVLLRGEPVSLFVPAALIAAILGVSGLAAMR